MVELAQCPICFEPLPSERSCEKNFESQIAFGKEQDFITNPNYRRYLTSVHYSYRCQGCDVQETGYHHALCPMEECPECHNKLFSCPHRGLKPIPEPRKPKWRI